MPSNFFSKAKGLHPTPSACFPPCPKPIKTFAYIRVTNHIQGGMPVYQVLWGIGTTKFPPNWDFEAIWNPSSLTPPGDNAIQNWRPQESVLLPSPPAGDYDLSVTFFNVIVPVITVTWQGKIL